MTVGRQHHLGGAASAWVVMARTEAREWFRENPQGTFDEFHRWVVEHYEPDVLTAGFGWIPGMPLSEKIREALDDAHVGLHLARDDELQRRRRAA